MEKNCQENAIEPIEPTETKIDIPTTEVDIDILSRTNKENIEVPQESETNETNDDILSRTKQHRENISRIIVPQYIHYIEDQYIHYIEDQYIENNYVVTYSY